MLVKRMFLCELCGSPYIRYTQTVDFEGFTLDGKDVVDIAYAGYAYCWVCESNMEAMDGYLIYADGKLYSLLEDYNRQLRIYEVPFTLQHDTVSPKKQSPQLLTTLQLNDFTRAILDTLLDDYAPKGRRFEMLHILIGEVSEYAK